MASLPSTCIARISTVKFTCMSRMLFQTMIIHEKRGSTMIKVCDPNIPGQECHWLHLASLIFRPPCRPALKKIPFCSIHTAHWRSKLYQDVCTDSSRFTISSAAAIIGTYFYLKSCCSKYYSAASLQKLNEDLLSQTLSF